MMKELAGVLVAAVLLADGLLHAYWFSGGTWPARDAKTLSLTILNIDIPFTTPFVLGLACALFLGALTALAQVHLLGQPGHLIPAPLLEVGVLVIAAGTLLRGLAGIGWALDLLASRTTLFYKLNLLVYTPACLVLCAAAVLAARF